MTARTNAVAAEGALVGTPGRPARPARPIRFTDPARNKAYWDRIERIVDAAPPLSMEQRATLRGLFHATAMEAAA